MPARPLPCQFLSSTQLALRKQLPFWFFFFYHSLGLPILELDMDGVNALSSLRTLCFEVHPCSCPSAISAFTSTSPMKLPTTVSLVPWPLASLPYFSCPPPYYCFTDTLPSDLSTPSSFLSQGCWAYGSFCPDSFLADGCRAALHSEFSSNVTSSEALPGSYSDTLHPNWTLREPSPYLFAHCSTSSAHMA